MSTVKQINVTREQVVALLGESKDADDEVMVQACLWTLEAFKPNPTFYEKAIGMVERAIAFCPPEAKMEHSDKEAYRLCREAVLKAIDNDDRTTGVILSNLETDNEGQLIVTTGVYRWSDDTYHNGPAPLSVRPEEKS